MVDADAISSGHTAHGHPAKEPDTAKDLQRSDSDETVLHAEEENEEVKEAELLIQRLNDLGIGEHVSDDEFNAYFDQLPSMPRIYPDAVKLTGEELDKQAVRLALYRFRSYEHKVQSTVPSIYRTIYHHTSCIYLFYATRAGLFNLLYSFSLILIMCRAVPSHRLQVKEEGKDDTLGLKDVSEDECDRQFHKKWGYFKQIEENWTLDWYFHPVYCKDPSLSDYQRLVLRNYVSYLLMHDESFNL